MLLPQIPERKEIGDLFERGDYAGLEKFGIRQVSGPAPYDCLAYVVHKLNCVSTPDTLKIIQDAPVSEFIPAHSGIAYYGFLFDTGKLPDNVHVPDSIKGKRNLTVRHYGWYENKQVTSKWQHGPVFQHELWAVPHFFGGHVLFRENDSELITELQLAERMKRL